MLYAGGIIKRRANIVLESYLKLLESILFHFGWQALLRVCPSVLIVPAHQNRTHKNMHHAFKTWCIVFMNDRYAITLALKVKVQAFFCLNLASAKGVLY